MVKTGLVEAIDSLVPLDEHLATFRGTDIQKESQKRPNQARDGKDKVNPKPKSNKIPQAPDRYGFYVDVEEHELGDLNEHVNYTAALSDPESDKWVKAMNAKMQSMTDN
ncbi:hypothetical protein Tco_0180037 [Tanacetum coccineum]